MKRREQHTEFWVIEIDSEGDGVNVDIHDCLREACQAYDALCLTETIVACELRKRRVIFDCVWSRTTVWEMCLAVRGDAQALAVEERHVQTEWAVY